MCLLACVLARIGDRTRVPAAAWSLGIAALLVVQPVGTAGYEARNDRDDSIEAAAAALPREGCAFSDSVSILLAADRYETSRSRCPSWIDGRGYTLTLLLDRPAAFYPAGFRAIPPWQRELLVQLQHATVLYLAYPPATNPEWSDGVRAYVRRDFVLRAQSRYGPRWQIWTREDR